MGTAFPRVPPRNDHWGKEKKAHVKLISISHNVEQAHVYSTSITARDDKFRRLL